MASCLITGGAGFLGSHLADHLLSEGHQVIVLDDLSTGKSENLADAAQGRDFKTVAGSVCDRELVSAHVHHADMVYHLASPVGVMRVMASPNTILQSMLDGMASVLDACWARRKPLLFTSSSEVYGPSPKVPTAETEPVVLGPPESSRWHYAAAKAANEHQAMAHWQETGLPTVVVRLFNVAGPRQAGKYGMVLPRFVRRALKGEPLTVVGDGRQTRCFAHVLDVVPALARLAWCERASGQVVNIGGDHEVPIKRLARDVLSVTGAKASIEHATIKEMYGEEFTDVRRRCPDLTKARELVAYRPLRTLEAIIEDVAKEMEHGS